MEQETKGAPETTETSSGAFTETNKLPESGTAEKGKSKTAQPKTKSGVGYLVFLCWFVYTMAYCGRYSYTSRMVLIFAV